MEILVVLTNHWVNIRKAIEYHKKRLKIAQEIGDRSGEGTAYGNLGCAYLSLNMGEYEKLLKSHSGEGAA